MGALAPDNTPGHRLAAAPGDRTSRPAWVRLAPFLGRPPALTRRQWRVLGLVAMASFFEMYDLYLLALTLKQIQADLAIPEASLGVLGSLVRLGALPARRGRARGQPGRSTHSVARDHSRLHALYGGHGLRPHGTGVRPPAMLCPNLCGGGDAGSRRRDRGRV